MLTQNKTGVKLRIKIEGDLLSTIDEIIKRNAAKKIVNLYLITDEKGQRITKEALRYRFDKAREIAGITKYDFQFRDLRAKATTDLQDLYQAKQTLGHKSISTTERYVRESGGINVKPIK